LKSTLVIIVAFVLLALSFFLFTDISFVSKRYSVAKVYVGDAVGPMLKAVGTPARVVGSVIDNYINLVDAKRKNEELKRKIAAMRVENFRLPELERENYRLKKMLDLTQQRPKQLVAARISGEDVANWFKCIIIDKGRAAGIREKMPVITPEGLVGQAVEVYRWHSKVMVINDINSSVDAYVIGKHTRGIVAGSGQAVLRLKYVLKNENFEVGDRLITSGKDAIFPRDIPIGIITNINKNNPGLFAEIDVMPFNNFKKIDEVLVVVKQ
jgi:rod shape-determining protein MreC